LLLLALALAEAEMDVDVGNERVVDSEERLLSIIEANALSCARDSHSVGREDVVAVCCVCLYLVHMQLDESFLPPPPLRALTCPRIAPSQSCPLLASFSNELHHQLRQSRHFNLNLDKRLFFFSSGLTKRPLVAIVN
jgi:hypothetical protein